MFLSDRDIKKALKKGEITIRPFRESQLQVVSYDVRLGNDFEVTDRHNIKVIDPVKRKYPKTRKITVQKGEEFVLHPGENVIGKQMEYIGCDLNHLILLSGKSSLARAGLVVHNTAMLFNPGHYFYPTFELVNTNSVPIILRPGMEIAQILFARLTSSAEKGYQDVGRYDEKNSTHFVEKRKIKNKKVKSSKKPKDK